MPTGYTSTLCDSEQSFQEFALTCARAFGACVDFRDQSLSTPLPEKVEASRYYAELVKSTENELATLNSMTTEERLAYGIAKKAEDLSQAEASLAEHTATATRLKDMILQVSRWTPPTEDHKGMKEFMLEQLNSTLSFDGDTSYSNRRLAEIKLKEPVLYYTEAVSSSKNSIEYYREQAQKDEARATDRTEWIQQLRKSLK